MDELTRVDYEFLALVDDINQLGISGNVYLDFEKCRNNMRQAIQYQRNLNI